MSSQDWNSRPTLWRMVEEPLASPDDEGDVVQRLIDHPDEARWRASHGANFLHHILEVSVHLSPDIIEKFIELSPESLRERNMYGLLPLHMVSCLTNDHHNPEIFSLILNRYPAAAGVCDDDGDYPINKTLYWSPFWMEENEYDERGKSSPPRKMLSIGNIQIVRMILEAYPRGGEAAGEYEFDIWQILCFLWLRDGLDDLFANLCELTDIVLQSRFVLRYGAEVPFLHLHAIVQERNDVLLIRKLRQYFLSRYGHQASMLDHNGRLCLNLAIEAGYKWSPAINHLCHAASRAVETRDMTTHFFPFMTAAIGRQADVNTVYELIRASPSLI
eukprot:CAMPEP_0196815814 /NCGR_PEP_ID=MMETSP1362-20130617/52029_1 /TAXON_ID=163516 /ORGANISM="Leptocylindrus danicus, Strain CCMP1856" /LENGTH=330 /DNA_ID=CAMNT_0042192929 /DNA_START=155 /DNA_END=1144 /DNA_ORIENTATION=+